MNFVDFSFWWVLALVLTPGLLTRRLLGERWPAAADRLLLLGVSLSLFYAASSRSFLVFAVELLANYALVAMLHGRQERTKTALVILAVVGNLSVLAYFKYYNFFLNDVLGLGTGVEHAAIPPGISFYTFQMIAFCIDSRRNADERVGLVDYLNFTAFFPQIVAGPIERRSALLGQIQRFRFRWRARAFDVGARWLSLGLFFKLVLANGVEGFIAYEETSNALVVAFSSALFGLRIYFDFAGYSLIAYGIARVLGIRLTINFRAPYTSGSMREFWGRWHVSLSRWFRDYLYIPFGGGRVRWVGLNLLIVFCVSGLWHGAAWNFVAWGAVHGVALALTRVWRWKKIPKPVAWALTMACVCFGWLFFMESDFSVLQSRLAALATPAAYAHSPFSLLPRLTLEKLVFALVVPASVCVIILEAWARRVGKKNEYTYLLRKPVVYLLTALSILCATNSDAQFIYFAF